MAETTVTVRDQAIDKDVPMVEAQRQRSQDEVLKVPDAEAQAAGVARIEGMQVVWGQLGLRLCIQFDNALLYNYRNYAASTFNNVAGLSTLAAAGSIIFAVAKPPIAKISDVVGRAEAYVFCISCYLLGYILCASSSTFGVYAGGFVFANIGQSGANVMNDIIITDITSMRWRAFAISVSFVPFLVTPWISGFIVEDVVRPGGIGWRWGIGMFALIMPISASTLIAPLLYYQRKAKKRGIVLTQPISVLGFLSSIDFGGTFLLTAGFAMFLLPFTLAASAPNKWSTGYIIALITVGAATLIGLVFYEGLFAKHPIFPARYLKNVSIVICCALGALDTLGFQATHTYFYAWLTVVHNLNARDATFVNYVNGVVQALCGMVAGAIIWRIRRYKWLMVIGAVIKLVGFGVMIRLRGANNSIAEIVVVQAIQGIGSGFIEIIIIVGAQIVVPRDQQAQVTALVLLFAFLGASIGDTAAGAIYSGDFRSALQRRLGADAPLALIDAVYESITSAEIPNASASQRAAINSAYSDVLRSITYVAVATSAACVVLSMLLPDHELVEGKTLVGISPSTDTEATENM